MKKNKNIKDTPHPQHIQETMDKILSNGPPKEDSPKKEEDREDIGTKKMKKKIDDNKSDNSFYDLFNSTSRKIVMAAVVIGGAYCASLVNNYTTEPVDNNQPIATMEAPTDAEQQKAREVIAEYKEQNGHSDNQTNELSERLGMDLSDLRTLARGVAENEKLTETAIQAMGDLSKEDRSWIKERLNDVDVKNNAQDLIEGISKKMRNNNRPN